MACACFTVPPPRLLSPLPPPPPASAAATLFSPRSYSPAATNRRLAVHRYCFSLLNNFHPFPSNPPLLPDHIGGDKNNNNTNNINNNNNNNNGGGGGDGNWSNSSGGADEGSPNDATNLILILCSRVLSMEDVNITFSSKNLLLFIIYLLSSFGCFQLASALAKTNSINDKETGNELEMVWEVSGGRRVKLIADHLRDTFVIAHGEDNSLASDGEEKHVSLRLASNLWVKSRDLFMRLMLPEGYPESVTGDYLEYSLWRGVQGVAAQISGVLATQSLLYAVGLGKGAIPTAAAVNWVLKDGIGYVSKIFLSKFGRHFDVNPKGWRLFADLLENAAFGMEIITPAFPHLFVPIGAVAGAGRSAAALIQAATRSCFYAGFAAQRNFAEVIAKGEAQGMVSKSIGIALGIALANYIHSSTPLALATFGVVTWIHMFCNLKSYQAIQLRTLNPYRASLVFSEYLLSGQVPSVKEVNEAEPFFPAFPLPILSSVGNGQSEVLSSDAKDAASNIDSRLQLGSKLSEIIKNEDEAFVLIDLYKNESYILTEHEGRYCVILKESSLPKDMLKSLYQVNYLYWLEKYAGIETKGPLQDCGSGGKLRISLEYVEREFNYVKNDGELTGWTTDSLIARPLPNRIRIGGDISLKI